MENCLVDCTPGGSNLWTIAGVLASVAVALLAVVVAYLAWRSDRLFRTQDALAKLLERFEAGGFHTLMWHMEQVTRSENVDARPWSLDPLGIPELEIRIDGDSDEQSAKRALVRRMLGQNYDDERAVMYELYFFALRVHAWTSASEKGVFAGRRRSRKVSQLNDTFGYQLLSTLLDHRIVAFRLERSDRDAQYFPAQYGCLDKATRELVAWLADDLLADDRDPAPHDEIRQPLQQRRDATDRRLAELSA